MRSKRVKREPSPIRITESIDLTNSDENRDSNDAHWIAPHAKPKSKLNPEIIDLVSDSEDEIDIFLPPISSPNLWIESCALNRIIHAAASVKHDDGRSRYRNDLYKTPYLPPNLLLSVVVFQIFLIHICYIYLFCSTYLAFIATVTPMCLCFFYIRM